MKKLAIILVFLLVSCQKKECVYIDGHWKKEITYYGGNVDYKASDTDYVHCYIVGQTLKAYHKTPQCDTFIYEKVLDCNDITVVSIIEFQYEYAFRFPLYYSIYKKIE
jgi:hypothetical protein